MAEDAKAAAYTYHRKQECQDLYNFSVAIMLREMQREVNTGQPVENRLHIDYASKNRPPQLHAADDLDCVLYGHSLMEEAGRAQNHEKTLEQHYHGSFCNFV